MTGEQADMQTKQKTWENENQRDFKDQKPQD
jgi:hypothetical protein